MTDERPSETQDPKYERDLGVTEAFIAVRDQCPMGAVRSVAMQGLEAAKQGGPGVLREQAYLVLTAIQGWRGERSRQVHRSLQAFLDAASSRDPTEPRRGSTRR